MFSRIEVARYKCLERVDVHLEPFHILIGPNASGKSTLLDSLAFVRDALATDVEQAVRKRAHSLRELVWRNEAVEQGFAIALEAVVPDHLRTSGYDRVRYEIGVGLDKTGAIVVSGENLWLVDARLARSAKAPASFSPDVRRPVVTRPRARSPQGYRVVVRKVPESGNDYFRSEKTDWNMMLRFSPQRLALAGIPEDADRFPLTLWFRQALLRNLQVLQLNSVLMRRPCPSDAPRSLQPDGSNVPLLVKALQADPQRFAWWLAHVQTIVTDLAAVTVAERPEDRAYYLVVTLRNGMNIPAWLLSDGTLRLLALTLLAYLPNDGQVFVIEEPENGIHPRAIEAVFQSLHSVYDGQVLLATHSPLMLALAEPRDLLIFTRTERGATAVINGADHPALPDWQRDLPLEALFGAGAVV